MRFALSTSRRATLPGRAADRALPRHSRRDRAPVVRAGLPRPRRPACASSPGARCSWARRWAACSRSPTSTSASRRAGASAWRSPRASSPTRSGRRCTGRRPRAHAHDHPREQLHAVHRELGGLLHRRHAHLGLRGLHADQRPAPCPCPRMLAWVFFLAVLGVTMAIPMKRQMINVEQLRFPAASRPRRRCARFTPSGTRACARRARSAWAGLHRRRRQVLGRRARAA